MREKEIGAYVFKIKSLTRKQFRERNLEKFGYGPLVFGDRPDGVTHSECVDALIKETLGEELYAKTDDLAPKEYGRLYVEIIKETYGDPDEEKNSPTSGTDSPETK